MVSHKPAWSEQDVIERLTERVLLPATGGLVLGIGDDCAIFRPRGSPEDLLFTTDMLIEGVHFLRETHTAEDAGWKALARGLSDIAAMGGEPRFCLLSLALARWADSRWLNGFYRGLLALAQAAGATLMGGDLAHSSIVAADIVVCGAAARGRAMAFTFRARSAARRLAWLPEWEKPAAAKRGRLMCVLNRGWHWAGFCGNICTPPRPWI